MATLQAFFHKLIWSPCKLETVALHVYLQFLAVKNCSGIFHEFVIIGSKNKFQICTRQIFFDRRALHMNQFYL
jgi:hypothetical protein